MFDLLSGQATGKRYDTIVLDPPAFAKSRKQLDRAMGAYKEINLRALRMLSPGGILVSCSCSHHVSEAELLGVIAQAALDAGENVAGPGTPDAGAGSSDIADGPGDALFEVSGV